MKAKFKEWIRRRLVTLKRHPNYIPLIMIIVCTLVFNLSLTSYSDTIASINEPGMGICLFAIVLCSFLSIITYLTAYPTRKKPKIGSIVLVSIMLVISIVLQFVFRYFIKYGTELKENPIEITEDRSFISIAQTNSMFHIILLCITLILLITLPLYKKALRKIDTTKEIKETDIEAIDIESDD